METTWRWVLVTAIAPIAWGSTYWVTREFLPPDAPLWGAVLRALPAGLLLLAVRPRLPRGAWWWRAAILGTLNVGVFFALIYLVAQLLPTSLASTIMATSPAAMMLLAWLFAGERLRLVPLVGAGLGIVGVALLLAGEGVAPAPVGIAASVLAMALSSLGYILAKRWREGTDVLSVTSWQLLAGGLLLLPAALVVEGGPPTLDVHGLLAFAYVSLIATAVAFVAWFAGLARLPAGTVGLVGLLNPVAGVLLGVLVAGERLGGWQVAGLAIVLVGIVMGQPAARRAIAWARERRRRRSLRPVASPRFARGHRTEVPSPLAADC
ncbi:DMT family transporter [Agromyces kandeliae]|uniref:EamA family transporter n=1 Tax=Agromyces kandeliae TaxID=2666141 RepID=A0A6L5QXE2_9MICO|nr:EamA family transporter [Agromyces kandeliae]MRX42365.1 EamA family transporter [Agromyces kandeliae]